MQQPGDRPPAPPPLDRIQQFVNSVDLLDGTDESFTSPAATADWLHDHAFTSERLRLNHTDVAEVIDVREAIRELCHVQRGSIEPDAARLARLSRAAERTRLVVDFADGGRLRTGAGGIDGVIGALVSVIQHAMLDGRLQRLKACKHCGWVFHDASRSRSGQWCTMAICGNRAKNRAHRQRHEPPEKPAS